MRFIKGGFLAGKRGGERKKGGGRRLFIRALFE